MDKTIIDSQELENEKGQIIVKGLKKSQKSKLLTGALSGIVGVLGGVGVMSAFSFVSKDDAGNAVEPETTNPEGATNEADPVMEEPIIIYTDAPFATSITDDMSFNEAFGAARSEVGQGGFFEWDGNTYNTYYKEEWDAMSEAEQNEFLNSVDENAIEVVAVVDPEPIEPIVPEPEPEPMPEPGPEEVVYEITEEDYIETGDMNGDGKIDIASVNANNNEIADVVIDINGDGTMDQLYLDVDLNAEELPDDVVIVDISPEPEPLDVDPTLEPNTPDLIAENDLNPEIDNHENMDDYTANA
jgi:hypothetical protein